MIRELLQKNDIFFVENFNQIIIVDGEAEPRQTFLIRQRILFQA